MAAGTFFAVGGKAENFGRMDIACECEQLIRYGDGIIEIRDEGLFEGAAADAENHRAVHVRLCTGAQ